MCTIDHVIFTATKISVVHLYSFTKPNSLRLNAFNEHYVHLLEIDGGGFIRLVTTKCTLCMYNVHVKYKNLETLLYRD